MKHAKPRSTRRRLLTALLVVLLATVAAPLAINLWMVGSTKKYLLTPEEAEKKNADCILVLGAGIQPDGSPSPILRDRLTVGVALYDGGASARLLMSGDHGREDHDEVNAMKAFAIENGVPSNAVFMDHAGFSTYDSMVRARDVFQVKTVVIVTQKYHLSRAVYIARSLGMDACGVPSDLQAYAAQAKYSAREAIARVKDFFAVLVRPRPAFLGEALPVAGNGDVTNDKPLPSDKPGSGTADSPADSEADSPAAE